MKNIRITFVLAKSRLNQLGKCSIRCRITHEKKRYEFSTGLFVKPKEWFNSAQEVRPSNKYNYFINTQLSLIKQKVNQAFLFLKVQGRDFNVENIYRQYKGEIIKDDKSIRIFAEKKMEGSIYGMFTTCLRRQIRAPILIPS